MPEQTVQALAALGAAEAENVQTSTDDLLVSVTSQAYCTPPANLPGDRAFEFMDRWIAPEETHPHMLQHRWDERTAMVAERLCAPCPVRSECLALAMRLPNFYEGWIRGGMTPAQRRLTLDDAIETGEAAR